MDQSPHINYFAQTDFRGRKITFGIKSEDRARHMYVIGKTGMGKSTMLENMAIQDIKNGEGMCFIDPHGKTAELLLEYIPKERLDDVLYIAPFDLEHPIAFNVMEDVGKDRRHLVAAGLMSAFHKIWVDAWSARMEYILNNTILALLEYPGSTLLSVNKMISDKKFREKVVACVTDPGVRSFWVDEFANYTERFAAEATPAIQNKVGQFTSNPLIRNILGQAKSSFDFRELMDQKKIVIINLSKGLIGEGNANLIGSMLITKIYLAAMSRANASDAEMTKLPPFYLYVDEFQSFANESFADILSEARKYKLSLTIAHQYIEQMPEEVRDAVFGNVGTTVVFRVGPFDAEVFEKIFFPTFTKEDLVSLGFAQIYMSLMIDGIGSKPFSAVTLPPIPALESSFKEEVVRRSRAKFTKARAEVEKEIIELHTAAGSSNGNPSSTRSNSNSHGHNGHNGNNRPRGDQPRRPLKGNDSAKVAPAPVAPAIPTPVTPSPAEDSNHQLKSGKEDINKAPAKVTDQSAVSLGHLKERSARAANNSKSTEKSRADLRNALQELMQSQVDKPKTTKESAPPQVKKTEPAPAANNLAKAKTSEARSKEVPEDVLRQMLEVKK